MEWGAKLCVLLGVRGPVQRILSFPGSEGSHVKVKDDSLTERARLIDSESLFTRSSAVTEKLG